MIDLIACTPGRTLLTALNRLGIQAFVDNPGISKPLHRGRLYGGGPYLPYHNYPALQKAMMTRSCLGAVGISFNSEVTNLHLAYRKALAPLLTLLPFVYVSDEHSQQWAAGLGIPAGRTFIGGHPAWLADVERLKATDYEEWPQLQVARNLPGEKPVVNAAGVGEAIYAWLRGCSVALEMSPESDAEETQADPMVRLAYQVGVPEALVAHNSSRDSVIRAALPLSPQVIEEQQRLAASSLSMMLVRDSRDWRVRLAELENSQ